MRSLTTKSFRKMLEDLPAEVQQHARDNFKQWQKSPASVDWKQLKGPRGEVWSASIGRSYRAIGVVSKEHHAVAWIFIGSHEDYNGYVANRRGLAAMKPVDFAARLEKHRQPNETHGTTQCADPSARRGRAHSG